MNRQRAFSFLESAGEISDSCLEGMPDCWRLLCREEFAKPYFVKLMEFVSQERLAGQVFPPAEDVFSAFRFTPLDEVKVLIVGQDPYHDDGQAHGLCFSVRRGVKTPPSLVNMFKEMQDDLGLDPPGHGNLEAWARQGVLLLNTVLTVRAHEANSHRKKGWEQFTDAVISRVSDHCEHVVFVLWGKPAEKKLALIDTSKHSVVQSAHPSPLSARRGFFGSKPYSRVNAFLEERDQAPVDWCLMDK